ncbi:MAG: tRNA-binding protein [Pyrinomonadaceae bacterium]
MVTELKPNVRIEDTFELLDIRVGKILSVEVAEKAVKASYKLSVDFGKFGIRISVARLTNHSVDDLVGRRVLGVLNFEPRVVGGIESQFLTLGVQIPKADSGEATIISPVIEVKLGSKLF